MLLELLSHSIASCSPLGAACEGSCKCLRRAPDASRDENPVQSPQLRRRRRLGAAAITERKLRAVKYTIVAGRQTAHWEVQRRGPSIKGRTNSAPLIDRGGADTNTQYIDGHGDQTAVSSNASTTPRVSSYAIGEAQDEDEVAGVVGAVRAYQPFKSFEVQQNREVECKEHKLIDFCDSRRQSPSRISTWLSLERVE